MFKLKENASPRPEFKIDGVPSHEYKPKKGHLDLLFKDTKYRKSWFKYQKEVDKWKTDNMVSLTKEERIDYIKEFFKNLD